MFNNFLKPGKGVPNEKVRKNGFFQYFYSVFLYFTKLFFINFISLPLIALYGFFMEAVKVELQLSSGMGYLFNIFSMVYYTLVGLAPFTLGITYVSSLLAREEPCFFISDFKKAIKDNFKQAIIIFILNIIFFYLLAVAYKFYFVTSLGVGPMRLGFVIIILIYLMMNIFTGYLAVTYKLTIGQIFKKALIFTILNLPQNIMVLLVLALVYGLVFSVTTLLGYTFSALLVYGFTMLLVSIYASRTVEKYRKR